MLAAQAKGLENQFVDRVMSSEQTFLLSLFHFFLQFLQSLFQNKEASWGACCRAANPLGCATLEENLTPFFLIFLILYF
jgi:hypothetical protein